MSLLSRLLRRRSPAGATGVSAGSGDLAAMLSQGNEDFLAGRTEGARATYNRVLELDPRNARAHYMLSGIAFQTDDAGGAVDFARSAIELEPNNADFHGWLAGVYASYQRMDEAILAYRDATQLEPGSMEWRAKLAGVLIQTGRLQEAVASYAGSPANTTPDARAYYELGEELLKHGELAKAEPVFEHAAMLDPESGGLHYFLALVRRDQFRPVDAEGPARRATVVAPDMPEGWFLLGSILARQASHVEAVQHYRTAISLNPGYEAAWDGLLFSMNWSERWSPREIYEAHMEWGRRFPKIEPVSIPPARMASRRIRVGYLSPDFREHSVVYFIEPVLQHHDRDRFEVYAYQTGAQDAITARVKARVEHWRSVGGISNEQLEQVLREDDLDILVELSGHTQGNSLGVMARRIAPVQVTYLGYPNTTGVPSIDYRITDARADPPGDADMLHIEQLVRLPETFLCYAPPAIADDTPVAPVHRNGHITFASFNNVRKITPVTIWLWSRILASVPDSRLLIKSRGFQDPGLRALVLSRFSEQGIDSGRVAVMEPIVHQEAHLKAYREVDIGLDSFPYHGTTTTMEALWMGVPVVTLQGDRHASRVGVSILCALGLTDLVAQTEDEYVQIAVRLATHVQDLDTLRQSLRSRLSQSPLTDGARFTAHLEQAYRQMWQDALARSNPNPSIPAQRE